MAQCGDRHIPELLSATGLATVGSLVASTGNFGSISATGAITSATSLSVNNPTSNNVVLANFLAPNLAVGNSASINLAGANIAFQHYLGESTYPDYLAITVDGASGDTFYVDGGGAVGTNYQTLDDGTGNMTVYGGLGSTTLSCSTTASIGQQLTVSGQQNGYSTRQILLRDAGATGYNMALGVNGGSQFGCVQVLNGSSYYPLLLNHLGGSVSTTKNTLDNGSGAMTVAGMLTASGATITNGLTANILNVYNSTDTAGIVLGSLFAPSLATGNNAQIRLGVANSAYQDGVLNFQYNSSGSTSNYISMYMDGANAQTLYVKGDSSAHTMNNTLDDGTGNMSVSSSLTAAGRGSFAGSVSSNPTAYPSANVGTFIDSRYGTTGGYIQANASSNTVQTALTLQPNAGPLYSCKSTLDDGSGNMTVNSSSTTPLTVATSQAGTSQISIQTSTNVPKLNLGWQSTNGCFLYDKVNNSYWLQQNGTTNGYIQTLNNVLDNGSGTMTIAGGAGFGGPVSISAPQNGLSSAQLIVADAAVPSYQMWVGSSSTGGYGLIQAAASGAYHQLYLNKLGGGVGTKNQILDDGTGNMTISHGLTVGLNCTVDGSLILGGSSGTTLSNATGPITVSLPSKAGTLALQLQSWNGVISASGNPAGLTQVQSTSGITLSSNTLTLPTGTYLLQANGCITVPASTQAQLTITLGGSAENWPSNNPGYVVNTSTTTSYIMFISASLYATTTSTMTAIISLQNGTPVNQLVFSVQQIA